MTGSKVAYEQLFNFEYADGPKMLTVGGLLLAQDDEAKVESCRFADLEQVAEGAVAIQVLVPVLTTREVLYLDSQLPGDTDPTSPGLPSREAANYARIHRHYPLFIDVDL